MVGQSLFPPSCHLQTQRTQKRLQSYEAHVDQRNQEAFKAWSFDQPVSAGGFGLLFFRGEAVVFFRVVPLNERKLTLEKSTVICGRMFLLLFFLWDFDGCVFFGWMFPWFFFMPVQNGTWNFPCGVFVGRSKLLCKNDMIWVGGIVLLRGHKDFGWSLFLGEGYSRMQHRGSFHWPKVVLESLKTNSSPQKTGAATYFQWLC